MKHDTTNTPAHIDVPCGTLLFGDARCGVTIEPLAKWNEQTETFLLFSDLTKTRKEAFVDLVAKPALLYLWELETFHADGLQTISWGYVFFQMLKSCHQNP